MGLDNSNIKGADELMRKLQEANEYISRDVNTVIGVEAVNHFKSSFENEGFSDKKLVKWESRKKKRSGDTDSQKVLSKSGDLGDSIDFTVKGSTTTTTTDKVYAQIHNEGLKGLAWGKHSFKMPKRQFMGPSEMLNEQIVNKITRDLTRILK